MASTPKEHSGSSTPNPLSSHQAHHHARRLLHFSRPNGVKVHIAHTPEEHEQLRKQLTEENPDEIFDVFIHGTPEHLSAIRELHAHHEARRDSLRDTHGDIYEQFEKVKSELDALSHELHMITDHGVSLDANFSKFGYSAHLRTKDDSGSASPTGDDVSSLRKHDDRSAEALKFWKRPTIRQYFHKGLLWRSSQSGEVASFELFADLLYVGVIGFIGDKAVEDPTGKSLLQFMITLSISWKIWSDLAMIINWFEIDDISQRISVLFYLVCLFGFTTNIAYGFESTYTSMLAFYVTERLFAGTWFIWVSVLLPTIRGTLLYHSTIIFISCALWIGSMHVEYPNQLALIFIALFIDLFGATLVIFIMRRAQRDGHMLKVLAKHFEFYPAINIEHRTERNSAFITLVFGYSVLTILFQNKAAFGINAFFGKGILGLIQAFSFNWIYFEIDQHAIHVHAIRRHWISSIVWVSAHLPFTMGYVLAAATLSKLVLAHDCSDTDPETLGEVSITKSGGELSAGLRWFYCGGIGAALLCMAVISLTHIHKRLHNPRLMKRPRLVIRVFVAIIIICLPTAKSLTSLDLISITTALVVFVLCLDLFGNSCEGDEFWTGGFCEERKKNCTYVASCRVEKRRRKEIEKALHRGEKVSLADLLKRHSSMSSLNSEKHPQDAEWQGGHY